MNIVIAGAGRLGYKLAASLVSGDYSIIVIDRDEQALSKVSQTLDVLPVNGDARNVDILRSVNIDKADYLIAATGSDETNIVVSAYSKKLGAKHVIARVRDPENMKQSDFIKETMDIDLVVNPDMSISLEIYKYLAEKYTLRNGIFTSGKISLIEFSSSKTPALTGKPIHEVRKQMPDMIVVAISRNGKVIIPRGDDIVTEGDALYVVGEKGRIQKLNKRVHENVIYTNLKNVMIIGGGKTGFYLAEKLAEFGAAVKLFERDKERCRYLSTALPGVMVLHGEGTDISLLEEENLDQMDAVVTCTGHDEENLLLALTAKNHGVEDVISKVSKAQYINLIDQMGIDIVLNSLDITSGKILGFIQGSDKLLSSVIIKGQAEIMEIIVLSHMNITGKSVAQLNIPSGILIAAIHRKNHVIIPTGDTVIELDDKIMIICLLSEIDKVESLIRDRK